MDDWFLKYAVEYDLDEIAEILNPMARRFNRSGGVMTDNTTICEVSDGS